MVRCCISCGLELVRGANWHESNVNKHLYRCDACANQVTNQWRSENPDQVQLQHAIQSINRQIDPVIRLMHQSDNRRSTLKTRYGLTNEEYYRLAEKQGFKCAICGRTIGNVLNVDHDHVTGRIRGLLCRYCNVLVDIIETKSTLLEKVRAYISSRQSER